MSRTVHGTACWECSDFNIKNTMGEECEGNKHIFCDKSLEEHDKKIKAEGIKELRDLLLDMFGMYRDGGHNFDAEKYLLDLKE